MAAGRQQCDERAGIARRAGKRNPLELLLRVEVIGEGPGQVALGGAGDQRHAVALELQVSQAGGDPRPVVHDPIGGQVEAEHVGEVLVGRRLEEGPVGGSRGAPPAEKASGLTPPGAPADDFAVFCPPFQ